MTTFFMPQTPHPSIISFIDHIKFEKRFSAHTIRAYTDDLNDFFDFLKAQFDIELAAEVTTPLVRSWMAALSHAEVQPRSINRKISSLKSFFKFCMVQGLVSVNPAKGITVMKVRKRLPSYIEETQMDALFTQVQFPDGLEGITDRLMLSLLYQTGMRVSELVSLKEGQIDRAGKQLKVLGKGNKERIIPVGEELLEMVEMYMKIKRDELGEYNSNHLLVTKRGMPHTSRSVYDVVKKYLSLVTTAEKKSPHILRHSFATHLTGNGAELNAVKELLGHSSLAATQVYTHNSIERLRDIHKKAHPKG
jgi:integrase/recombinase XerC